MSKPKHIPSSEHSPDQTAQPQGEPDPLLERLLNKPSSEQSGNPGLVVGEVISISDTGSLRIALPDSSEVEALPFCAIGPEDVGRQCAVALAPGGSASQAIILGLLQHPVWVESTRANSEQADNAQTDGSLSLDCPEGIELRCGPASLTLSPDGRIELRGITVVSHAEELHRIKAGSVRIN